MILLIYVVNNKSTAHRRTPDFYFYLVNLNQYFHVRSEILGKQGKSEISVQLPFRKGKVSLLDQSLDPVIFYGFGGLRGWYPKFWGKGPVLEFISEPHYPGILHLL
jgi:hypothetical protein